MKKIRVALLALAMTIMAGCGEKEKETGVELESKWVNIEKNAIDKEVKFYMWSGDAQINRYVDNWVADGLKERYGITLKRVPIVDIKDTVNKLIIEKKAGKKDGSIDMIWINGENFKTAKENGLLWGPFAQKLPAVESYVNEKTLMYDFGEPIENLEAPWGEAQFVFIYDRAKNENPPKSVDELKEWVMKNPGKFTYPAPPNFTGSAFIRHMVYEVTGGYEQYMKPLDKEEMSEKLQPVWEYLNEIEPYLWRNGETYPESQAKLHQLYSNGEVYITMGYHPLTAESKIREGQFPKTSKTYLLDKGTLFNNHYLTIPFNAKEKSGAMVAINFLLSPEAQAAKADPANWGDNTILDMDKLSVEDREKFESIDLGEASVSNEELASKRVPELSAEYVEFIEKEWEKNVAQN